MKLVCKDHMTSVICHTILFIKLLPRACSKELDIYVVNFVAAAAEYEYLLFKNISYVFRCHGAERLNKGNREAAKGKQTAP